MPGDFPWLDHHIDALKRYWKKGWTATQIGGQLGCTRNAVLGKLHRLGLAGRISGGGHTGKLDKISGVRARRRGNSGGGVTHRVKSRLQAKQAPQQLTSKKAVEAQIKARQAPDSRPCTIVDLDSTRCHWPIWHHHEYATPDKKYCGGTVAAPHLYCGYHLGVAWGRIAVTP